MASLSAIVIRCLRLQETHRRVYGNAFCRDASFAVVCCCFNGWTEHWRAHSYAVFIVYDNFSHQKLILLGGYPTWYEKGIGMVRGNQFIGYGFGAGYPLAFGRRYGGTGSGTLGADDPPAA